MTQPQDSIISKSRIKSFFTSNTKNNQVESKNKNKEISRLESYTQHNGIESNNNKKN